MERPGATTMRGNPLTLLGPELKAGDAAPDFTAVDSAMQPVTLDKVRVVNLLDLFEVEVY